MFPSGKTCGLGDNVKGMECCVSNPARLVIVGGFCVIAIVGLAAMFSPALREDRGQFDGRVGYATNRYPGSTPYQVRSASAAAFNNPRGFCMVPPAASAAAFNNSWGFCTVPPAASATPLPVNTRWNGIVAPPISPQAERPQVIKEFAMEAVSAEGFGARVTGVMGNSNAQKGGLQAGDIITKVGATDVRDVQHLKLLLSEAPPEANIAVEILRDGNPKRLSVMVGEGEMEGVTPIVR